MDLEVLVFVQVKNIRVLGEQVDWYRWIGIEGDKSVYSYWATVVTVVDADHVDTIGWVGTHRGTMINGCYSRLISNCALSLSQVAT